jgi:hypothetical protein
LLAEVVQVAALMRQRLLQVLTAVFPVAVQAVADRHKQSEHPQQAAQAAQA